MQKELDNTLALVEKSMQWSSWKGEKWILIHLSLALLKAKVVSVSRLTDEVK
ncbi:MAG: hypothetical protein Q7J06_08135 [Bacteroidales bacterium]|nr:hypothetical protein [Bacteroidales bacterium]